MSQLILNKLLINSNFTA